MRIISYECDRCGNKIAGGNVVKLNITLQHDMNFMEKRNYDFCPTCFLKVKMLWQNALSITETENTKQTKDVIEPVFMSTVKTDTVMTDTNVASENMEPFAVKESVLIKEIDIDMGLNKNIVCEESNTKEPVLELTEANPVMAETFVESMPKKTRT